MVVGTEEAAGERDVLCYVDWNLFYLMISINFYFIMNFTFY